MDSASQRKNQLPVISARPVAVDQQHDGQRSRLLGGIFECIEAELMDGEVGLVAAPKPAWTPFFESVPLERETGIEPATSTLGRLHSRPELEMASKCPEEAYSPPCATAIESTRIAKTVLDFGCL